jgi:DNA-binding response OmpR family regulator
MKLLIIEDEVSLSDSMVTYLHGDNYFCEVAHDCRTAREKIGSSGYDCILLDITLTDGNGLALLKELKAGKRTDGVIIISARNSIHEKIEGLNLGADDYLGKPFYLSELSARIAAVLRRRSSGKKEILVFNELTIDLTDATVAVNNHPVELTRKEYDLLLYLVSNNGRVISKNAIAKHLSGEVPAGNDNFDFIYSHIKNLKRKLQSAGCGDNIRSIYGMGYKFETKNRGC